MKNSNYAIGDMLYMVYFDEDLRRWTVKLKEEVVAIRITESAEYTRFFTKCEYKLRGSAEFVPEGNFYSKYGWASKAAQKMNEKIWATTINKVLNKH